MADRILSSPMADRSRSIVLGMWEKIGDSIAQRGEIVKRRSGVFRFPNGEMRGVLSEKCVFLPLKNSEKRDILRKSNI